MDPLSTALIDKPQSSMNITALLLAARNIGGEQLVTSDIVLDQISTVRQGGQA